MLNRFLLFSLLLYGINCSLFGGRTTLVSKKTDGTQANDDSRYIGAVSSDGAFAAFSSGADNLITGDTNGVYDIFRHSSLGETILISRSTGGAKGDGASYWPVMSDDGRYIAFFSYSTNLVSDDTNGMWDVFRHDTVTKETICISKNGTVQNNGAIDSLDISADGLVVAFSSNASSLVAGDTNGTWDVFVWKNDALSRVSVPSSPSTAQGNGPSFAPTLSDNGRYVVFESYASNLVSSDTNGRTDVFRHDCDTGATIRVSLRDDETQAMLGDSSTGSVSDDGNLVAFVSSASDLASGDSNNRTDVFVRNISAGTTTRVVGPSAQANGQCQEVAISGDGRYLSFISDASNLVADDTNGAVDVFRYAIGAGTIERVSVSDTAVQGHGRSYARSISKTGQYILFQSYSNNLTAGDANGTGDMFVRDMDWTAAGTPGTGTAGTGATVSAGATLRVSVDGDEIDATDDSAGGAAVSDDGRWVAFSSSATNLVASDTNNVQDVFLRDTTTGTTIRISEGPAAVEANGNSYQPVMSADGEIIVFLSEATNLVAGDTNAFTDVFVYSRLLGTVSRVTAGVEADGPSIHPAISPDGSKIAYSSLAGNLVLDDTNGTWDIFVRSAASTTRVSISSAGVEANGGSFSPSITDSGLVAFSSMATNLVSGDTNGRSDVFVRDGSTTERVSVTSAGGQHYGGHSYTPSISNDGSSVTFMSMGWDLFADDFNATSDIILHTRSTNAITRISKGASESNGWAFNPKISTDGRYVAFECDASNLIANDTNGAADVFVYDSTGSSISRVSVSYQGKQADDRSYLAGIASNCNRIAFHSYDTSLVPGDTNATGDVFIRTIDATGVVPEMKVLGKGIEIASGDTLPDAADNTDFGSTAMTLSGITHTFTIANEGSAILSLTGSPVVSVTGDTSDFIVIAQPVAWIDPTASRAFQVRFLPTAIGDRTATITIVSDDADESSYTFGVKGTGLAPDIRLSYGAEEIVSGNITPTTTHGTDFGIVSLGGAQETSTFNIENIGSYALELTGTPVIEITGAHSGDFSVATPQPTGPLAISGLLTFDLQFDPQGAGPREAMVSISSDDPDEGTYTFAVKGEGNQSPTADATATTNVRKLDEVTLSASGSGDPDGASVSLTYHWEYTSGPMSPGPDLSPNSMSEIVTFVPTEVGTYVFDVTVSDGFTSDTAQVTIKVSTRTRLITGSVLAGSDAWLDVNLPFNYHSMVVVCTMQYGYDSSRPPLTARVMDAAGSSFKLRLFRADGASDPIRNIPVHYFVVEEGTYTSLDDGIKMEAKTYLSTQVSRKNAWSVGTIQSYQNHPYTSPIVIGQVMSTNDINHQVFWANDGNATNPPSSSSLATGRHIGEDQNIARLDETIGYVVMEAGASLADGIYLYAGRTANAVVGMANGPYSQSVTAFTPAAVVLSSVGMNGGDGSYPVLNGADAIGSNVFKVSMEEDTLGDMERAHTSEEVDYVVFDTSSNAFPFAQEQSIETDANTPVAVNLSGVNLSGSETWTIETNPAHGTLTGTGANRTFTPDPDYEGPDSFTFFITDNAITSNTVTVSINVRPINPFLMTGRVIAQTDAWTTVPLPRTFAKMVVVCTPAYDPTSLPPMAVRVQNATGNSFEVRLYRADNIAATITNIPVHYVVIEEGVYTVAGNGAKVEAKRFTSFIVAERDRWYATELNYVNSYTQPVVIGQVITTNDPAYQMFWAMDGNAVNVPSSSSLYVGRHVGEDPNRFRANEDVGYIVFEAGTGILSGINYEADLTPDNVTQNISTEAVSTLSPEVVILSSAGMDGNNGGFPIIAETSLLSGGFKLSYEEDRLGDAEQSHTTENVAFVAFKSSAATQAFANGQSLTYATPPFLASKNVAMAAPNEPMIITLSATSVDPSSIWTIVQATTSGILAGDPPNMTYTPNAGFAGTDHFTFKVTNGMGDSNTAIVTITVAPAVTNEAPVVESVWAGPDPDALSSPANLEVVAWDPEDDSLTHRWEIVDGPGTVSFSKAANASLSLNLSSLSQSMASSASGDVTQASFSETGQYTLKVTTTDSNDQSKVSYMTVNVSEVPSAGGSSGSGGGGGCALSDTNDLGLSVLLLIVAMIAISWHARTPVTE